MPVDQYRMFDLIILLIVFLSVNLDGVSTYLALKSGAKEVNPIRAALIRKLGLGSGSVGVSVCSSIVLILIWPSLRVLVGDAYAGLMYTSVASVMIWASFRNIKIINKNKKV